MADHLASIFGTEKDRVNCPFYFKIGACRHGDRCSRAHNRPTISQTMLLKNMYQNPVVTAPLGLDGLPIQVDERYVQENYEDFYEDVFEEVGQFGEIENLNVCDNIADHLVGNVYIKFRDEEACAAALRSLQGRFYDGRPIISEFSPVTDFREATCRQYEENTCNRGGYCNFMHLKPISKELRKRLFGRYPKRNSPERDRGDRDRDRPRDGRDRGGHDRDRDRGRDRDRYDGRDRGGGGGGRRDRESSAERRAKIAAWNRERDDGGDRGGGGGGGGGYPMPPAPGGDGGHGGGYDAYGAAYGGSGGGGGGGGDGGYHHAGGAPPGY